MNPRKNERNRKIVEARKKGLQYKEIAREFGLCESRVCKIYNNQIRWDEGK